jgi:Xaa-Pro aminopeptidase
VRDLHSEEEAAVYASRLDGLRTAAAQSGASAVLVYADVSRANGIDYLTGFCLYWNEAVLAVPLDGPPALITKLSKRVQPWIKRSSILEDIRSGPNLAGNTAAFLEERLGTGRSRVAVCDMSWWPNGLLASLGAALPTSELADLPAGVRSLRMLPDAQELGVLRQAGSLLQSAVDDAQRRGTNMAERSELAVRNARRAGFLDVEIDGKSLGDGTEYLDALGQYRYAWVRLCRPRGGLEGTRAAEWLKEAIAAIRPGVSERDLEAAVRSRIGRRYRYSVTCLPHAEIESRGAFRLPQEHLRPFQAGEVVSPSLTLAADGSFVRSAETLIEGRNGAEPLTASGLG